MSLALVWIRKDLRLRDNPALAYAVANYQQVLCIYIHETDHETIGDAQAWWLHHSLTAFIHDLTHCGGELYIARGRADIILNELITRYQPSALLWNRRYEPAAIAIDQAIKTRYSQQLTVQSFNSHLLFEPWTIQNKSQSYFKVFTPFWRHCLSVLTLPALAAAVTKVNAPARDPASLTIADLKLLPTKPDWASRFGLVWQPGEDGASKQLQRFLNNGLERYLQGRDEPAIAGTSRLSPHLHFGELSIRELWQIITLQQHADISIQQTEGYQRELIWREFAYHLQYHVPAFAEKNFRSQFDNFPWLDHADYYQAWTRGLTGYPLVDAGMRELWQTGYMHNRVRMIAASFLTKHCLIDWRRGAAWFKQTLLDHDLANNTAGWQWVAGSGADAAPYFRIFNPVLQGQKFDPAGDYVKRFCPELAKLPTKYLHQPWLASPTLLASADLVLGENYPNPIVDHGDARARALAAYQQI